MEKQGSSSIDPRLSMSKEELIQEIDRLEAKLGPISAATTTALANEGLHELSTMENLLDHLPVGVTAKDRDGKYLYTNQLVSDWFGREKDDIIGCVAEEVVDDASEVVAERIAHERLVFETGQIQTREVNKTRLGGRLIETLIKKFPIKDLNGRIAAVGTILMDITDLRQHQQASAESQKRLSDMLAVASDWLWETDPDYKFVFFGGNTIWSLGRTAESFTGLSVLSGDPFVWDSEEDLLCHREVIESEEGFQNVECNYYWPDGEKRRIRIGGKPVYSQDGVFQGYRGIASDVTDRWLAVQEMVLAKQEAEIANRTKTEFLANVSHELRTPLNAILGFSEMIKQEIFGAIDNPKYTEYAEAIHSSGSHLLKLIGDVIDIAKVEVGELEILEETISLPKTLTTCRDMVMERAAAQGVGLALDIANAPATCLMDELRLRQIILNLLDNAIKFTHRDGTVTLSCLKAEGGDLIIRISDTGEGIDPAELPHVTDLFTQGKNSLREGKGTGLGLAITNSLIEVLNGRLTIDSTLGAGTNVTIHLPSWRLDRAAA